MHGLKNQDHLMWKRLTCLTLKIKKKTLKFELHFCKFFWDNFK